MKKIILPIIILGSSLLFGQTVKNGNLSTDSMRYLKDINFDSRQEGWYISGNNSLLFSQNSFSNWIAGGVNSFALNANFDYEFNLTKGKNIWDNRVTLGYGLQKNQEEGTRKTNDIINLTSSYGYNIGNSWYLSAAMAFNTQFTNGYDYKTEPKTKISNLMAPGYLSLGLGIDYKPNKNLQVNIHPFTPRATFVLDKDLQKKDKFGLKADGDNAVLEFGAYLGARYKFQIMDGISYDNRIGIYTNYLHKFGNMDIAYLGTLDLKVNRFVSAQLSVNLLYYENQIKKVQLKQTLGIGFNYKFDNKVKEEVPETAFIQEQPIFEDKENSLEVATNNLIDESILNKRKLVTQ